MPMTADQIIEEARHWPRERLAELVERLSLAMQAKVAPDIEDSWRQVTRRRVAELESGQVEAVPGEAVTDRVRQIVRR